MVSQNLINISASALTSYVNCVKYHYYYMYWYMYVNSCNQYNVIWYICIVLRRYQMGREKSMNIMQKSRFIYSNHLYKFAVLLLVNFSDIYIECIYDTLVSPTYWNYSIVNTTEVQYTMSSLYIQLMTVIILKSVTTFISSYYTLPIHFNFLRQS